MGITHAETEIYIGPMTNYTVMEQPGRAVVQCTATALDSYERVGVYFDENLHGLTLMPNFAALQFTDMDPARWDLVGDWLTCPVPNHGIHLYSYEAGANLVTSATSLGMYVDNPTLLLSLQRADDAPAGQTEQRWAFRFGWQTDADTQGFLLVLYGKRPAGKSCDPELYGPVDPATGDRVLLSTYKLEQSERRDYAAVNPLNVTIRPVGGDLCINFLKLSRPWVIRRTGPIEAGYVDLTGAGTAFAFSCEAATYPVDPDLHLCIGWAITGWLEHELADTFRFGQVWPTQQDGTNVSITEEERLGTKRRYRITLLGNKYHSPVVRAWQAVCRPVQQAYRPAITWHSVPYFKDGSESLDMDPAASATTLTFVNNGATLFEHPFRDFLWTLGGEFTHGNIALYYLTGYRYDDGSYDSSVRMFGIVQAPTQHSGMDGDTVTWTVHDRCAQLDGQELWNSPCLIGWPVEEAMAILAEWGGIPPEDIIIYAAPSLYSIEGGGFYLRPVTPDPPIERYLLGNTEEMSTPMWLLNGETCWEAIKRIGDRYGVVAEFGAAGKLYLRELRFRETSTTPIATYDTAPGTPDAFAVKSVDLAHDLQGRYNRVVMEGRDADGHALLATIYDQDSIHTPGSDHYLGYERVLRTRDDELMDQASVNLAARNRLFAELPKYTIRLEGSYASLWRLYERDLIRLIDNHTDAGYRYYRVRRVTIHLGLVILETSIDAEEVQYGGVSLWSGGSPGPAAFAVEKHLNRLRPLKPGLTVDGAPVQTLNDPTTGGRYFTIAVSDIGGPDRLKPD